MDPITELIGLDGGGGGGRMGKKNLIFKLVSAALYCQPDSFSVKPE